MPGGGSPFLDALDLDVEEVEDPPYERPMFGATGTYMHSYSPLQQQLPFTTTYTANTSTVGTSYQSAADILDKR